MSRLAARTVRRAMLEEQAKALADAALNTTGTRIIGTRTDGWDERRARGIPILGGVAGAIPGTRPDRDAPSLRHRER